MYKGIKVLIEFIPNHTSRRHPWFLESRRGGASNYKNFYVWSSGRSGANGLTVPPNNWVFNIAVNFYEGLIDPVITVINKFKYQQPFFRVTSLFIDYVNGVM